MKRRIEYARLLNMFCNNKELEELLKEVIIDSSLRVYAELDSNGKETVDINIPLFNKLLVDLNTAKLVMENKGGNIGE